MNSVLKAVALMAAAIILAFVLMVEAVARLLVYLFLGGFI